MMDWSNMIGSIASQMPAGLDKVALAGVPAPAQPVAPPVAPAAPVDYKALAARQAEQKARRAKFKMNRPAVEAAVAGKDLGQMIEGGRAAGGLGPTGGFMPPPRPASAAGVVTKSQMVR